MAQTPNLPVDAAAAADLEHCFFTNGPVDSDAFYSVPAGSLKASPGTLLKVEVDSNASLYNLPPGVAISRIIFESATLQGSPVPASVSILWPYQPRRQIDRSLPVVAWAHGTSGL